MSSKPPLHASWMTYIGTEFEKPYMQALRKFLQEEKKKYNVFPPMGDLFNAFWHTPFDEVKVVILGQDPYHGPGQAHGLCFSVKMGVKPPPSLMNIYKEIANDLTIQMPKHGNLVHWAKNGVMLLNTSLTVRAGQAGSHRGQGWETFTDKVIQTLNEKKQGLVFLLWGAPAQGKAVLLDPEKHLILKAPHPSPLSAHRGFFGCKHFSKTNNHLISQGREPIDWELPFD